VGIERQGTRSNKHDGSAVLLRKILKELTEIKNKLNTSFNDNGDLWKEIGKSKRKGNIK